MQISYLNMKTSVMVSAMGAIDDIGLVGLPDEVAKSSKKLQIDAKSSQKLTKVVRIAKSCKKLPKKMSKLAKKLPLYPLSPMIWSGLVCLFGVGFT